jgi:predicted membrane protein
MSRNNNFNQIFWGAAIIIVGLLFLLQNFGFVRDFEFWNFLPVILILLGGYQLFVNQFRAWVGPLIMILVGSYLLMATLNFIAWGTFWSLIWPTILILVGISIIFRKGFGGTEFSQEDRGQFSSFAAFSGQKRNVTAPDFQNGEITAMFGGAEIDLRNAAITNPPARIQTTVMFGGADIFVPADWDVRVNVVALFGGTDDKRHNLAPAKETPDLVISGTVMFGGLDIKS